MRVSAPTLPSATRGVMAVSNRFTPLDAGHEALQKLVKALSPDPAWPTAKCGDCGWANLKTRLCRRGRFSGGIDSVKYDKDGKEIERIYDLACPGFTARLGEVK